jgi:hypothetical protein
VKSISGFEKRIWANTTFCDSFYNVCNSEPSDVSVPKYILIKQFILLYLQFYVSFCLQFQSGVSFVNKLRYSVGLEVLRAVVKKSSSFWNKTQCIQLKVN